MTWTRLGGVAALLGGLAWSVKGFVILAGGDQPPLLFEVAPALFGIALLSIAHSAMPKGRRRTAAMGFAVVSIGADFVAVVTEVVGEVAGAAIAASSLALVIGLVTLDRRQPSPTPLAWWIGVAMLPAVFVGGMLSEIDERLLEVPLVCLGVAWMFVGWAVLEPRESSRETVG
jgi:undecaprenyl pyrophosphate phosphatase UppP